MSQMAAAWGGTAPHKVSEYYYNASTLLVPGIPTSGKISLSQFVGKKIYKTTSSTTTLRTDSDGWSVASSSDGSTIAFTDPTVGVNNLLVYVGNTDGTYTLQKTLTGVFGYVISITNSGDTICAISANNPAVYVFQRTGTSWNQQTTIPLPDTYGRKVSVSGDGNIMIALTDATFIIYKRTDSTWAEQVRSGFFQGSSASGASVSDDGSTVAVGFGVSGNYNCYLKVYSYISGAWQSQTVYSDVSTSNFAFGSGIALSKNGNTLVVGAPQYYYGTFPNGWAANGAVYILERSAAGGAYTQIFKDVPNLQNSNRNFGSFVSVNSDGTVVTASSPNASTTYVYVRPANSTTWTRQVILSSAARCTVSADGGTLVTTASTGTTGGTKPVKVY